MTLLGVFFVAGARFVMGALGIKWDEVYLRERVDMERYIASGTLLFNQVRNMSCRSCTAPRCRGLRV